MGIFVKFRINLAHSLQHLLTRQHLQPLTFTRKQSVRNRGKILGIFYFVAPAKIYEKVIYNIDPWSKTKGAIGRVFPQKYGNMFSPLISFLPLRSPQFDSRQFSHYRATALSYFFI